MAVVANQAVAFDNHVDGLSHLGDVLRPGLILDHGLPFPNPVGEGLPTIHPGSSNVNCPFGRSDN